MSEYAIEATSSEAKHIIDLLKAEAEGRLVILPCKVGDMVFANMDGHKGGYLDECRIWRIEYSKDYAEPLFTAACVKKAKYQTYWESDFGKEIFLEPPVLLVKKRKKH